MAERAQRYTAVAIVLHWAIAAAILFLIPLGFWMHDAAEDGHTGQGLFAAYQLHKSIGLTVLALSLVRLGWRFANPPPPLPQHMPGWEKFVAKLTHWAFYALMIGLPLTGWLFVSAGWSIHDDAPLPVPTHWFGLFEVPHLFGLNQASLDVREDAAEAALTAHAYLAFAALGLAALHVAAALKHHFFDRDATLAHMLPGLRAPHETEAAPKAPGRLAVLGVGLGATAIAACAALFAVSSFIAAPEQPAPASVEAETDSAAMTPPSIAVGEPNPATPAASSAWRVDHRSSAITFGYFYEDGSGRTPFTGRFGRWSADIRFDPNDLDNARVVVRIQMASASTGVEAHDGALPAPGWFNTAAFPTAEFRSTRIRSRGDGQYEMRGDLTIRGETKSVDLPFTLNISGDRATVSGQTMIDRRDFEIGDPAAGDDLISRDIDVSVRVAANRTP